MTSLRQPRRILMTADTVGGVWTYALELSRGLAAHDIAVVLATMGPLPDETQRREAAALENVTLCESDFRLEWMESPWRDVDRAGAWLLELESEFAPDIVHLNGYAHAVLPFSKPTLVAAHSCVASWWQAVHGTQLPEAWDEYRTRVTRGLQAADAVIAPTQEMLSALERHYDIEPHASANPWGDFAPRSHQRSAWSVIPNGRDPTRFGAAAKKEPLVLSVGRLWDEAKNASALATIASELRWPVWVAGDAAAPSGVRRELRNVVVMGRCSAVQLASLYSRAAIYALPARYEPFGLSALEAAFSGCALVLGDIPSLREIWADAALFVPPDDPAALREAIAELIDDAELRQWLAARAAMRAGEFTTARMVTGYLELYRELLARRAEAPSSGEVLHA